MILVAAALVLAAGPTASSSSTPAPDAPAAHAAKPKPCKKLKRKPPRCRKKPKRKPPARPPAQPRPRTPSPRAVSVAVDAARSVGGQLSPAGGGATATAADGTTYTLTIPQGAVLDEVAIKLTPIASVQNLPLSGGFVAGVHLEPEGLRLLQRATLVITPSRSVPDNTRTGFAYYDLGREFHLYPIRGSASAVTFSVTHFSGYGVGEGTQSDRSQQAAGNPPSDPLDQAQQQTAAGPIPSPAHEQSLLATYFVISSLLPSPTTLDSAVSTYVGWKALAQGFVTTYPRLAALVTDLERNQFPSQMRRHIEFFRAQCIAQRDLTQVRQILRIAGYAQFIPTLAVLRPDVDVALDRCVRFELDMELTLKEQAPIEPSSATVRFQGLPLRSATGGFPFAATLTGQKELTVASYGVDDADCWTHTWAVTPTSPFVVRSLEFDINLYGAGSPPADLRVEVDPGALDEQITHICNGDPETRYTDQRQTYVTCFRTVHPDGRIGPWQYVGASVWARGTFSRSSGECSVATTFELRHTPG